MFNLLRRDIFSDVKHIIAHVLVNTVDSVKNIFMVKEYSDACKSRPESLQDISTKDNIRSVENNMLLNCPCTNAEILQEEDILDQIWGLKGKTTRRTLSFVVLTFLTYTLAKELLACKKYKGIVFMDKDRNVIYDLNKLEDEIFEITVVEDHALRETQQNAKDTANVTGVENTQPMSQECKVKKTLA